MLFIHYFLQQIKQNFCILLDFVVTVVAHLLYKNKKKKKKKKKKLENSPFLNEHHYSNNTLFFFQSKCINLVISDRPTNLRKEMLQADELFLKLLS